MIFIILILAANPCVEVKSGIVVVGEKEVSIGNGTFCPDPTDKNLAKKIVEKNSMIKKLQIQLDAEQQRREREVQHWVEVEDRWAESHKKCRLRVLALESFWNRWGKTILIAGIAAAAAAGGTYLLIKADVIPAGH